MQPAEGELDGVLRLEAPLQRPPLERREDMPVDVNTVEDDELGVARSTRDLHAIAESKRGAATTACVSSNLRPEAPGPGHFAVAHATAPRYSSIRSISRAR